MLWRYHEVALGARHRVRSVPTGNGETSTTGNADDAEGRPEYYWIGSYNQELSVYVLSHCELGRGRCHGHGAYCTIIGGPERCQKSEYGHLKVHPSIVCSTK